MVATASTLKSVRLQDTTVGGLFWGERLETNRSATLTAEHHQCEITGRFDALQLDWREGQPNKPHIFWDSDIAKWIEAAAYSLATHPDPELEAQVDGIVDLLEAAQQPDGYLNTYFTAVEPDKRWANLRDWHELYCAGHLMEASVAYADATGKRKLLNVMTRYADYIGTVFGRGDQQKRGYPGHQEIELALVKLYHATGERRYLDLASYFIDERGQQPHYFDLEAAARDDDPKAYWARTYHYNQSHVPVREQGEVVGHSVRACYMYAGMVDVAAETGDATLVEACKRLWQNMVEKQLYITGGIGQTRANEGFTFDYDLPNETAYTETCASIALIFWAQRMFHLEPKAEYIDVAEQALYNGVLSGVSLDGTQFFYANPLASYPGVSPRRADGVMHVSEEQHYRREDWFDCACCPPNLARLLASLGSYFYSTQGDMIYVHFYGDSSVRVNTSSGAVTLTQATSYPWDELVTLRMQTASPSHLALKLRIPGWCQGATLQLNGQSQPLDVTDGYAVLEREWVDGDVVELRLPMPVERIYAHPAVRQDAGRVALQRGPLIYCLEEADNGQNLADVVLPRDAQFQVEHNGSLLGGATVIHGDALRTPTDAWEGQLYRRGVAQARARFRFTAIPYFLWANREAGEMRVWMLEAST